MQGVWSTEGLDGDIHYLLSAVGAHHYILERDGLFLAQRFLESGRQFVAQTFARHGKDVPVGFASRRFQIFSRASADVENVAFVVGQHRGRGIRLQEQLICQRLQVGRRFQRLGRRAGLGGDKGCRELDRLRSQGRIQPPVQPCFSSQRREQVGKVTNGLRAPQK